MAQHKIPTYINEIIYHRYLCYKNVYDYFLINNNCMQSIKYLKSFDVYVYSLRLLFIFQWLSKRVIYYSIFSVKCNNNIVRF